jgi:DNA modification methylase
MPAQEDPFRFNVLDANPFRLGGLEYRSGLIELDRLRANPRNARVHSRTQIKKLMRSIRGGFGAPIVVDEYSTILAGHGRLEAARNLGLKEVPVYQISGLSEARKLAYLHADNRIALDAGWDRGKLIADLPELTAILQHEGLTIEDTGFEVEDFDRMTLDLADADPPDNVDLSELDRPPVSQGGDLFSLGPHRLLVGDATEKVCWDRLTLGEPADCAFVDSPYNIPSEQIGGRGKTRHGDFVMGSGEMSPETFTSFLSTTHRHLAEHCRNGAVVFSCMDWRQIDRLLTACRAIFGVLLNIAVWVKTNAGQGSFHRSKHEFVTIWRVGDEAHLNNVQLGRFGRSRSNVWEYPGANTFRRGRLDDLKAHATVKNLDMVADALRDCTRPGDLVLDCFGGSGTTLLAAEKIGRRAFLMEIDPKYADVVVERWQAFTGCDAVHEASGSTFQELRKTRAVTTPVSTPPVARLRVRSRS